MPTYVPTYVTEAPSYSPSYVTDAPSYTPTFAAASSGRGDLNLVGFGRE